MHAYTPAWSLLMRKSKLPAAFQQEGRLGTLSTLGRNRQLLSENQAHVFLAC